jgi:hypothetical protein
MTIPATILYLSRAYYTRKNQKGGTLIVEEVFDREQHHQWLCNPDNYRPSSCLDCQGAKLHAHSFRDRRIRGDPESAVEQVRRYLCVSCKAVWTVLPAFLARHLHRNWETVNSALVKAGVLKPTGNEKRVNVPASTVRRWKRRLCSSAGVLIQVLAAAGIRLSAVIRNLPNACTRIEFIEELLRQDFLVTAGLKTYQISRDRNQPE